MSRTLLDAVSIDVAAKMLGVTRKTLNRWRLRNYGPRSFRFGGRRVYEKKEVTQWLASIRPSSSR
jgi:DNA-binding transcriptional MerR regulator